jgi:hypothetical protein
MKDSAEQIFEELQGSLINKKLARLSILNEKNGARSAKSQRVRSMSTLLLMLDCGTVVASEEDGSNAIKSSTSKLSRHSSMLSSTSSSNDSYLYKYLSC